MRKSNGSAADPDSSSVDWLPPQATVSEHPTTPSFGQPPMGSVDDDAMQEQIARRLFPATRGSSDPSPAEPTAELRTLGGFEVISRLGSGGMGVVYAARDNNLDRLVALKVLRHMPATDDGGERLLAEAQALAKLSHPNVVQIHNAVRHDGNVILVMEFVKGETLARWQQRPHRLVQILDVYRQAGAGLIAAHAAGIVHRDFKPANVLCGDDGRVRVVDFGLASLVSSPIETDRLDTLGSTNERRPRVVGTPGYLAPELLAGEHASKASDQFGYCVSLWEALCGIRPLTMRDLFDAVEQGHLSPRGSFRPRWLRRALTRGLSLRPEDRWPSIETLLEHIDGRLRARRIGSISAPVILAVGTLAGLAVREQPETPACPAEVGVERWSREQEHELLWAASSAPDVRPSARAVSNELRRYLALWDQTQRELCEAHFDRATLSAEGFDLAQDCLDGLRDRTEHVIDGLVRTPRDVARFEGVIDTLASPRSCLDIHALRVSQRVSFASLGERVSTKPLLETVDQAIAEGQYQHADVMVGKLLEHTQRQLDRSMHAAALMRMGIIERKLGEIESARDHFEQAIVEANAAGDARSHFVALRELAELEAYEFERVATAELALALARAPLTTLGDPPELVAKAQTTAALIAQIDGRHAEAESLLRKTLEVQLELQLSPAQLDETHLRIANSLAYQGRSDAAIDAYAELVDRQIERLGHEHPALATLYFNIGLTWAELGRWADARPLIEQALASQTRTYGGESLRVAQVLTALAEIETELGNHLRALELGERAVELQSARLPPGHPERDAGLATFAWSLLQAGQLQRSLVAHQQLFEQINPAWADQRAGLSVTIGWLLCRTHNCTNAWAHIELALQAESARVRAKARALAVEIALDAEAEKLAEVMAKFEAELAMVPDDEVDEVFRAEHAWLRARVAAATSTDRDEVTKLIERAHELGRHLQPDQLADLADLQVR